MKRIKRMAIILCLLPAALPTLAALEVSIEGAKEYSIAETVVLKANVECSLPAGTLDFLWSTGERTQSINLGTLTAGEHPYTVWVTKTPPPPGAVETGNASTTVTNVSLSTISIAAGSSVPIPPGGECQVQVTVDPGDETHSATWTIVERTPDPDQSQEAIDAFLAISIASDGQSGEDVFGRITVPDESGLGLPFTRN